MAAGSGQVLSGAVQGPGGLLGREQPVLPRPGFQHRACSQGNGAAQLPGAARSEMAQQDRLEHRAFELGRSRPHRHGADRDGDGERNALSARALQAEDRQYRLALQIFNHHTVISAKKGAPVDWIKMEPVTGTLSVISVHKNAPHPNAAKLLVDFITSSEGQNIFRDAEYLPADPTVPALTPSLKPDEGGFRTHFFTPEQTEDNMVAWKKVYDDLFR